MLCHKSSEIKKIAFKVKLGWKKKSLDKCNKNYGKEHNLNYYDLQ